MKNEIELHYFRTEQKIHTNVIINITRANAAPIIYRLVLDILDLVGSSILLFSRFENVVVLKGSVFDIDPIATDDEPLTKTFMKILSK